MSDGSFYEILQVTDQAESEVIEAAYKRLAFKYHPDRNPGAGDGRLRQLNQAYETLRDPQRRAQYDAQRNAQDCKVADDYLQQLDRHVRAMLEQGTSAEDVINNLVQMGFDREVTVRMVDAVLESQEVEQPASYLWLTSPGQSHVQLA